MRELAWAQLARLGSMTRGAISALETSHRPLSCSPVEVKTDIFFAHSTQRYRSQKDGCKRMQCEDYLLRFVGFPGSAIMQLQGSR